MFSEERLFQYSCLYRFLNLWLVQTAFVPDEYWQSIEPAHRLVFCYGDLPWEWKEGLRSYLYPFFFAVMYKTLALLNLDSRLLVIMIPRLAQSVLAALADVYLYKFAKLLYGEKAAFWTVVCYWLNWFTFFCSTRTLANTVEAQLTIIALYYYPWPANYLYDSRRRPSSSSFTYMTIVALSTVIRPTSAVFWIPLCLWHLRRSQHRFSFIFTTVAFTLPIVLLSIAVDRVCYGKMVISLWQFLRFNVLEGGSAHFGVNPWHWYVSNCLPTICFTHIILVAYGIQVTKDRTFLALCSFYIFIHSLLAHKELRFLLPLLAPLFTYSGRYIDIIYRRSSQPRRTIDSDHRLQRSSSAWDYCQWAPKRVKALVAFLFLTNLPVILYTGLFHQRGVLDVQGYLHQEYTLISQHPSGRMGVWYLTPCFTSPGHSHLHAPIPVRMLDCSPNLDNSSNYMDEADRFHSNPSAWLDRNLPLDTNRTHIVMYEMLWRKVIKRRLTALGYVICAKFYNTDFPQSKRQSTHLIVACLM